MTDRWYHDDVSLADVDAARRAFFARAGQGLPVVEMFDHLPGVSFWIKDAELRFVAGNRAFVLLCGRLHEQEIVGCTDLDFFPAVLAEKFRADDREVLRTGDRRLNLVELVPAADGTVDWYATNKFPVLEHGVRGRARIIGVAGTTRLLRRSGQVLQPYRELAGVLEQISQGLGGPLSVRALARRAGMSLSQLERKFKDLLQVTPAQYIAKARLTAACRALATTRMPVAEVARATGFYDASHFCRVFARHMGQTPTAYRAAYLGKAARGE